ncbi:hypothetical protein PVAND_009383 [Polypedilum vanderplanki]|uniref:Uncharacterized protein n=1 Tax=Polypedilum vanderplanki TaxID=319348 RepID=A0A9J6CDX8_POLVA|nr:hypothetical protein PVAND_009383 [Polypedilum vanderplanki]
MRFTVIFAILIAFIAFTKANPTEEEHEEVDVISSEYFEEEFQGIQPAACVDIKLPQNIPSAEEELKNQQYSNMKTNFNVYPRQNGIAYPQIYSKFKVKSKNIDEIEKEEEEFYIQDLTEDLFDDAVDFIVEYHARGSIFHRAGKYFY